MVGEDMCSAIGALFMNFLNESHLFEWEISSTSPPGGNQVDGLPPASSFPNAPRAPTPLFATKIWHFGQCFGSCSAAHNLNNEVASDIETRIFKLQFGPGPRSQLAIALELFDLQNRHMNTIWTEKSENDENISPDRFRSSPGQKIKPRNENSESQRLKIIQN